MTTEMLICNDRVGSIYGHGHRQAYTFKPYMIQSCQKQPPE